MTLGSDPINTINTARHQRLYAVNNLRLENEQKY